MASQLDKKEPIVTNSHRFIVALGVIFLSLFVIVLAFYLRFKSARYLVSGLVSDPTKILQTTNNRTNLVFLGLGGEGHEAPDLTDSMIFISLSHQTSSITMISLPRDIWVPTMKAKINTAYHYGNKKRDDGGRDLAKSAVSEILGLPVHYVIALDFAGFVKAVDSVEGIDVEVKRTFDDYQYPIPGKEAVLPESDRYEHLHFDAGLTHMDGATALKFARSRHAEGEEGTDFARANRQQLIILAFKDKLLSSETLLNFDKLKNIYASIKSSVDTDIPESELAGFFRFFLDFSREGQTVNHLTLEDKFMNPKNRTPYDGQWVLIPKVTMEEIHQYVKENLAK